MTVDEIFSKIASHMIKGMMVHESLANYYDFLSLRGYKRMHEYHYFDESVCYRKICRYFISHYNKLVPYAKVDNPEVVPENWYRYTRDQVDISTKKNAIKKGVTTWVEWEKETKKLYEQMALELQKLGEVAAMEKVKCLVCDVDHELKMAERHMLDLKAIDFSLEVIIPDQARIHDKYKEMMKCLI